MTTRQQSVSDGITFCGEPGGQRPRARALKSTDLDLSHVIGRDGHLDQSHG